MGEHKLSKEENTEQDFWIYASLWHVFLLTDMFLLKTVQFLKKENIIYLPIYPAVNKIKAYKNGQEPLELM